MHLQTDNQTIEDLRLFSKGDTKGIFDLYNISFTRGGQLLMESMFRQPLSNQEAIEKRIRIISAFASLQTKFPFDASQLDEMEKYISFDENTDGGSKVYLSEKEIQTGIQSAIGIIHAIRHFAENGDIVKVKELAAERETVLRLLHTPALAPVLQEKSGSKISFAALTAFDVLLRTREKPVLQQLLRFVYDIDVYISVALTAQKNGLVFPVVHPKGSGILKVDGVYHPLIKNAVPNNLHMDKETTQVFLTGANMAGKSTFLRSFSTAVFIAHMGFPVAVSAMEFSVMDGVYTTINLPDNLGIGASHFYAEVLRVKKMAKELNEGKSVFVLFDELFRGTNVKDALEGTIAVCHAFATRKNSKFIISSHIIEAAEELKKKSNNAFYYLPTIMNGTVPAYTYRLEKGVTNDKHGMIIINNEGILEILKNGRKNGV